ncbi:MAG TPA: carbon-nitrogen hydrolase family protein [Gemmatimonadaceae bacterium]|nr:carbon-nitrogen hydrolase family protein [Gemmatimonadaceae bacterium]
MDDRIRVATLQYLIRPVETYAQFAAQVTGLVETAADYKCRLVLFPEYFTLQLLTLGDVRSPIREQVRRLSTYVPRYVELFSTLAKAHGLYICAGTIPVADNGNVHNESFFFGPDGAHGVQTKLHMTRFEAEEWIVQSRNRLTVFDTALGRIAIAICYDVQFPEVARAAARRGARILLVPSCTDDRQGMLRVRYCAQARAIENQMYVVTSHTVGSLPMVPAVSLNYGQAAILTPSDFQFARDGVLAEGIPNQETMVIAELDMTDIERARTSGTVLQLLDSGRTARLVAEVDEVTL